MVANISKIVEINAAEIKECKENIHGIIKEMLRLIRENEELKEKILESENYKRRRNLKIHGLRGKDDEHIQDEKEILSRVAPQWPSLMESVVDTVHRLGRREEGKHSQAIIKFSMRHHWDAFWKLSKSCTICKDLGIHFKISAKPTVTLMLLKMEQAQERMCTTEVMQDTLMVTGL